MGEMTAKTAILTLTTPIGMMNVSFGTSCAKPKEVSKEMVDMTVKRRRPFRGGLPKVIEYLMTRATTYLANPWSGDIR